MSRRPWTPEEVCWLRQAYPHVSTEQVAARLQCSVQRVYKKASDLGLTKTPEFLASPAACRLRRGGDVGKTTRFQPGQHSWNKGMRYQPGGRCAETQFKPGQKPHTWQPVGSLRVRSDGYLERKVTDTGYPPRDWVGVHRLVWIEAHGPIPPGHAVAFRPGRRTTELDKITLDALELVTRAELMARNTVHRLPREVAELVQLRGALVRQINRREKRA